ncbi:hypothetical protein IU486_02570 [Streptomyces gardneri]|uniref:hypothetical protein n=1 Tax=Nocardia TaxID=1817 RepID=UPI00135BB4A4|nr:MULTISPECIES: hypothetical protein [Nocardia]MBF6163656.1 hypothetical protein [Streptomyces gardneri]MBF6208351.1 hypothetical protein [Streptomyces gardneri]
MSTQPHDRRRPEGRSAREPRTPGSSRPAVQPNPTGAGEKPWGGVMCGHHRAREQR